MIDRLGSRAEVGGLVALLGFTLVAVSGYAFFAVRPQNLALVPFAAGFFGISFQFFAQLHILICFAALAIVLVSRSGTRWVAPLVAVGVVSFTAEHMGTGYGIPFGGYGYTALLGPRIGPRVPALIPLSWFLMALPSWVVANWAFPDRWIGRVVLGSLGLVLWDLALDPAMSSLTSYWLWEETGPYYGMPWMNLVGWFVTGVALMVTLELFARRGAFEGLPVGWMLAFYVTVLLLPLGMLVGATSWLGVVTTIAAYAVTTAIVLPLRSKPGDPRSMESGSSSTPSPVGAS